MSELLCRALYGDVVLCIKDNLLVADNRTTYVNVIRGCQPDVFCTDESRVFDLACVYEDILAVERAGVLQCIFRLDDDVSS